MAGGWAPDGAEQQQIDDSLNDALQYARAALPQGQSARECAECGEPIPEARRSAIPGVKLCIECQKARDARPQLRGGINRRGTQDSQLK